MTERVSLPEALGMVAMADAEVDEWVVLAFAAALYPLDIAHVRLLVASDSLGSKISKLKSLLEARGYECSGVGPQHAPLVEIVRRTNQLKSQRDVAVHSFYGPADGERYTRFRSRGNRSDETTIDELYHYVNELRGIADEWATVVKQIEHQNGAAQSIGSEASALLEDCRELLATSRVVDSAKLTALHGGGELRIALGGHGRWRVLHTDEDPKADEHAALLDLAIGRISISMSDGTTVEGGDTGWRDVTQLASDEDPAVEAAVLRRVHGQVYYVQRGGVLEVEKVQDSLARRIFGDKTAVNLPNFLAELDGFTPGEQTDRHTH